MSATKCGLLLYLANHFPGKEGMKYYMNIDKNELLEISPDQVAMIASLFSGDPKSLAPLIVRMIDDTADSLLGLTHPLVIAALNAPFDEPLTVDKVSDRLDSVIGKDNWTSEISTAGDAYGCRLTILGVSKSFIGDTPDTAFMATARLFGVGRDMSGSPIKVWNTTAPCVDTPPKRTRRTKEQVAADTAAAVGSDAAAEVFGDTPENTTPAEEAPSAEVTEGDSQPGDPDYDPFSESAIVSNDVVPEGTQVDTRVPEAASKSILDEVESALPADKKNAAREETLPAETPTAPTTNGGNTTCVVCTRIVPGKTIEECTKRGLPPLHPKCEENYKP